MVPSKIHVWSCISRQASSSTPKKVVKHLSKIKFNGESSFYAFNHVHQFILNCNNFDIDDDIMCRIFTLTFTCHAKEWYESLPISSVNSWDEFSRIFLHTFQDSNCTQVYLELENLCRIEGESY